MRDLKELHPDKGLRIFDIKWRTDTAGPSPNNNERIEVFLLGCNKAMKGKACKGCFNSITWDKSKAEWSWDPVEVADMINEGCDPNNKYITIGGGEPTDQIEMLIPFVKRLKEHGFHIMMYTWRDLKHELDLVLNHHMTAYYGTLSTEKLAFARNMWKLTHHLDIIVDGEYKQEERLYQQELGDGMLSSIGSGNQRVWDIKAMNEGDIVISRYAMRDLAGLYVKPDTKDLVYITKE